MTTLRLRQAVVAAADLDATVAALTRELGLGRPFHDPGVEQFGLCNSVLPVGDTFLEVVSPLHIGGGSAAERFMVRSAGDCGYMAIFQVDDMDGTRAHLDGLGIRRVLDIDLDDIRCSHVHPADVGAAIVSFDQATPESSWRWAGPTWMDEVRTDMVTGLAGLHLRAADPDALLSRWANALAVKPDANRLVLPDQSYVSVTAAGSGAVGLVGIDLWAAEDVAERSFRLAGTEFRLVQRGAPGRTRPVS